MTREERLIAYVDGELSPEDGARFEAEIAADAALRREVARHMALAARVNAAYAPVLEEPIPPQLAAVAAAANDRGRPGLGRLLPWAGIAASLAVGVLAGRAAWPEQGPIIARGGALEARGRIAEALESQLGGQPGAVQVGLTLKVADGRYCRTFGSAPDHLAGVACRDGGRWRVRTLTAWAPAAQPAYRQAGSAMPSEVLASVDALGGETLDAPAEQAARNHGWR